MGSVISYDYSCPRCESECFDEYYYKSDEEYIFCSKCGYSYNRTLKEDGGGFDEVTKEPYGLFEIRYEDGVATSFAQLSTEKYYEEMKDRMFSNTKYYEVILRRYIDNNFDNTIYHKTERKKSNLSPEDDPWGEEE